MVKIAWKVVNGYGPYAYLQKSVKKAGGKVVSEHIAYLGKAGAGGPVPGKQFKADPVEGEFDGGLVDVPPVPEETAQKLKPKLQTAVQWLEHQVAEGVPRKDITDKPPPDFKGSTTGAELGATEPPTPGSQMDASAGEAAPKSKPAITYPEYIAEDYSDFTTPENAKALEDAANSSDDPDAALEHLTTLAAEMKRSSGDYVETNALDNLESALAQQLKDKGGVIQPKDKNGKPVLTPEQLASLKKAAASGSIGDLQAAAQEIMGDTVSHANKAKIASAVADLLDYTEAQAVANVDNLKNVPALDQIDVPELPDGTPMVSAEDVAKLHQAATSSDDPDVAMANLKKAHSETMEGKQVDLGIYNVYQQMAKPLEKQGAVPHFEDADGNPALSPAELKTLKDAFAMGNSATLEKAINDLAGEKDSPEFHPVQATGYSLKMALDDLSKAKLNQTAAANQVASDMHKAKVQAEELAELPKIRPHQIPAKNGKNLVSAANVKKLETAAATGHPEYLQEVADGMASGIKGSDKQQAVQDVAGVLAAQMESAQMESGDADLIGQFHMAYADVPKDDDGKPTVTVAQIKTLQEGAEQALFHDNPDLLTISYQQLVNKNNSKYQNAKSKKAKDALVAEWQNLGKAHYHFKDQLTAAMAKEAADEPEVAAPAAEPTPDQGALPGALNDVPHPVDGDWQPILNSEQVDQLQAAATSSDDPKESVANLKAAAESMAEGLEEPQEQAAVNTLAQAYEAVIQDQPASAAPTAATAAEVAPNTGVVAPAPSAEPATAPEPSWTQIGPQKGSTKGGVYENQDGEVFYVKCPASEKHIRNEMLAFDLYETAGLNVPYTMATTMDGQVCMASQIIEGLSEGGTNPKDLKGAQEGFAADAWLANWDSVGVGTTKYDNILGKDGMAYRVDAGGALMFRGTGMPKGTAFGEKVTELEGLRDPSVNPVAATVFGDMTMEEIAESADRVTSITDGEIEQTVAANFPNDAKTAKELTQKLIARRDYIADWVKEKTGSEPATPAAEMAQAAEPEVAPNTGAPQKYVVPPSPEGDDGKPLVPPNMIQEIEDAANSSEDPKEAHQAVQDLLHPDQLQMLKTTEQKEAYLEIWNGVKDQINGDYYKTSQIAKMEAAVASGGDPDATMEELLKRYNQAMKGGVDAVKPDITEAFDQLKAPLQQQAAVAVLKSPKGAPHLTDANVNLLKEAAKTGDADHLQEVSDKMAAAYKSQSKKLAIKNVTDQMQDAIASGNLGPAPAAEPEAAPDFADDYDITLPESAEWMVDQNGDMLLTPEQIEALNAGAQQEFLGNDGALYEAYAQVEKEFGEQKAAVKSGKEKDAIYPKEDALIQAYEHLDQKVQNALDAAADVDAPTPAVSQETLAKLVLASKSSPDKQAAMNSLVKAAVVAAAAAQTPEEKQAIKEHMEGLAELLAVDGAVIVPHDDDGEPIVSNADLASLTQAAATGDVEHLEAVHETLQPDYKGENAHALAYVWNQVKEQFDDDPTVFGAGGTLQQVKDKVQAEKDAQSQVMSMYDIPEDSYGKPALGPSLVTEMHQATTHHDPQVAADDLTETVKEFWDSEPSQAAKDASTSLYFEMLKPLQEQGAVGVPKDDNGQPLLSYQQLADLREAWKSGDPDQLTATHDKLAAEMKTDQEKAALETATKQYQSKMAAVSQETVATAGPPPEFKLADPPATLTEEQIDDLEGSANSDDDLDESLINLGDLTNQMLKDSSSPAETVAIQTAYGQLSGQLHQAGAVTNTIGADGQPMLTGDQVATLKAAAATGDVSHLKKVAADMQAAETHLAKKAAVNIAASDLEKYAAAMSAGQPADAEPVAPNFGAAGVGSKVLHWKYTVKQVPQDSDGDPILDASVIESLQDAANSSDDITDAEENLWKAFQAASAAGDTQEEKSAAQKVFFDLKDQINSASFVNAAVDEMVEIPGLDLEPDEAMNQLSGHFQKAANYATPEHMAVLLATYEPLQAELHAKGAVLMPKDVKDKPLVTAANLAKLKAAWETGDPDAVEAAADKLANKQGKDEKKAAIKNVADQLKQGLAAGAPADSDQTTPAAQQSDTTIVENTAAAAQGELELAAQSGDPEVLKKVTENLLNSIHSQEAKDLIQAASDKLAAEMGTDAELKYKVDVAEMPKAFQEVLTDGQIQKLEAAANSSDHLQTAFGNVGQAYEDLKAQAQPGAEGLALLSAYSQLTNQMSESISDEDLEPDAQPAPAPAATSVAPNFLPSEIPVGPGGGPVIHHDNFKKYLDAANSRDDPTAAIDALYQVQKQTTSVATPHTALVAQQKLLKDLVDQLKAAGGLDIPKDVSGKYKVSPANLKALKDAAATGDGDHLLAAADDLVKKYKKFQTKNAIQQVAFQLNQHILKADQPPPPAEPQPDPAAFYGDDFAEYSPAPAPSVSQETAPAAAAAPAVKPKLKAADIPKDNKGKALISKVNVKKLETAAATGDVDQLAEVSSALADKMLSPAKKAAIHNAAGALQEQITGQPVLEGDGGSGLDDAIAGVSSGDVKLPSQSVPSPTVVKAQEKELQSDTKDWEADLEKIDGQKGSNEGGLFKDKQLQTMHYLKWPNSEARAKNETLSALLYAIAEVPVPNVRYLEFQGKDAVMSDWIEDAKPMTFADMKKHPDLADGFAVDAWLANWDVVGATADNVVAGPGNKAYRIDLGGSVLFRAQGKGRNFPPEVQELETLRSTVTAKQAGQVFGGLTQAQIKKSAEKVADVTDDEIDFAVDFVNFPKTSPEYPVSLYGPDANDLPAMLKARLKARRDYIVDDILKAEEKKAATLAQLKDKSDLKEDSLAEIAAAAPKYTYASPSPSAKWQLAQNVMETELGKTKGKKAQAAVKKHYSSWKGSSASTDGQTLRWATGEAADGDGRKEIKRLERFMDFLIKKGYTTQSGKTKLLDHINSVAGSDRGINLVEGLKIANQQNDAALQVKHPGKDKITVYRGWKSDQVEYLELKGAKVGDVITLEDPPLYSWSFTPNVASNFGHGSIVTKAQVPIENVMLTDLMNSSGSYSSENEVVFKGVDDFKMEVTHKY